MPVAAMPPEAQSLVLAVVEEFYALLPTGPWAARMREVAAALDQTWFCWIGGHQPGDVFYYRIQSPVVLVELDHHCGVFLDYDNPQALPRAHRAAGPARQRLRPGLGPSVAGRPP